jgi:hypothetical protein
MSMAEEEEKEKAAAVVHVTNAAFPQDHLAPWMGQLKDRQVFGLAVLKAIGINSERIDRHAWKDMHPKEKMPDGMKKAEEADAKLEDDFDVDMNARGAAANYGQNIITFVQCVHDYSPSADGIRTRQAIAIAAAVKSGMSPTALQAQEPKKAHWWSGTPKNEISGFR